MFNVSSWVNVENRFPGVTDGTNEGEIVGMVRLGVHDLLIGLLSGMYFIFGQSPNLLSYLPDPSVDDYTVAMTTL